MPPENAAKNLAFIIPKGILIVALKIEEWNINQHHFS